MTVSSQISKNGPYDCNGSQVAFPFTFKVFTKNDLIVVLTDIATDIETDLVVDTNYTVSLNADQNNNPGGTVTTVTTYPTGQKITIARDIALTQQVNVTNFRPDVIERTFDKLTMLIQQVQEGVSRAIKTKISSEDSPDELMAALDASVQAATTAANQAGIYATEAENQAMDAAAAAGEAQAAANAAANSPVAAPTHAATSKAVPDDNDEIPLIDSAVSFGLKRLTWSNLKLALKAYFDLNKTGVIFLWPFPTAPAGALAIPLVPTNVSRITYANLHAVSQAQGYPWGPGDGTTTFGLPNLQADGTWLHANGNVASTTTGVVKEHTHNVNTGNTGVGNYPVCGPSSGNVSTVANQLAGGTANIAAGSRGLWCIWI